ncbi:PfkB family carbohydrate kinase [Ostreiculturibacter nitratireducens]|uniref:PfkB family carbohydrate kinase n=1 Tax=Ostreiculturibacter nitratireducens TaxID=3075226 RepID=UPI0031B5E38A
MKSSPPDIICVGAAHWDVIGRATEVMRPGADVPGRITRSPGGVALNVAVALARFGLRPALLSSIGCDAEGDALVSAATDLGVDCRHVWRDGGLPTDSYVAVEDTGGLIAAVADARSLEAAGAAILAALSDGRLGRDGAPWTGTIALDGNLTQALLSAIVQSPLYSEADLRVVPASPTKVTRLLPLLDTQRATVYLNLEEAQGLCGKELPGASEAATALVRLGARRAIVTDGGRPCADASKEGLLTATPPSVHITRFTGAGDSFMAAHMAAEIRGAGRRDALTRALDAAARHISEGA